jgi:hypothetical protein
VQVFMQEVQQADSLDPAHLFFKQLPLQNEDSLSVRRLFFLRADDTYLLTNEFVNTSPNSITALSLISAGNAVFTLSPHSQHIRIGEPFNISWSFSNPPTLTDPVHGFFLRWFTTLQPIFPEPGQTLTNGTFTWLGGPPNDSLHLSPGAQSSILAERDPS